MKFKVGDPVQAMYFGGKGGTTLGPGFVTVIEQRDDGDYWMTVEIEGVGPRRFVVLKSGATDYVLTQTESDALRALNPNFRN